MSDLRDLYSQLRYQLAPVSVTTMGNCPACAKPSRGAGMCHTCLLAALIDAAPRYDWHYLRERLLESRMAILTAEQFIADEEAGNG